MLNPITRTDARVLQQFGLNPAAYRAFGLPGHDGLDLEAEYGQQLYSPCDGIIAGLFHDPLGWGENLAIDDHQGGRWYLCHLSSFQASKVGDSVVLGTPVCLAGMSGNTNWRHVHTTLVPNLAWATTPYRGRVDPEPFLAALGIPPL